jgi:hypothetical protein
MTPAKPAARTPPPPPAAAPRAHAPLGPHLPARVPTGALFAHVLAAHAGKPTKGDLSALATPKESQAGTSGAQTALPEAVRGLTDEPQGHGHRGSRREEDALDPSARQAAQLAPPMTVAPRQDTSQAASLANARVSLEDLVPQLVKKIAWSGDAQRGTVRMELGAGELSGATLTVSAEHGRVSVRVDAPPGTDTSAWRDRLAARLEAKGLAIDSVEVR